MTSLRNALICWARLFSFHLQWNPSNVDTIGATLCVWNIEAFVFWRLLVYFSEPLFIRHFHVCAIPSNLRVWAVWWTCVYKALFFLFHLPFLYMSSDWSTMTDWLMYRLLLDKFYVLWDCREPCTVLMVGTIIVPLECSIFTPQVLNAPCWAGHT